MAIIFRDHQLESDLSAFIDPDGGKVMISLHEQSEILFTFEDKKEVKEFIRQLNILIDE